MTTKAVTQQQNFKTFITSEGVKNRINQIIGGANGQRFITSISSAVSTNPELAQCDNSTILNAALVGEALKLSPSPQLGQYYMVPFKDNTHKRMVATFIIGYKGYIQLALRTGQYKKLNVLAIKQGELVYYDPLDEEIQVNLIKDETKREQAPTIGYYAMFEYLNGFKKTLYWSKEKMQNHAVMYSKGYSARKGYTFWEKDFDAMAYKTMLRQLISKWGIMSIDMQTALTSDGAMINADGNAEYVDVEAVQEQVSSELSALPQPSEATEVADFDEETGEILPDEPESENFNKVMGVL